MNQKLDQEWRTLFLGREEELQWLEEAWKLTIENKPQIRVITSESGYGKTKLAQAFYTLLSKKHDRDGYWPDNLLHEEKNLQVMPDMSGVKTSITIPWIWWGVRWLNPDERNLPTSENTFLSTFSDSKFKWHQETLLAAVHAKDAALKTLLSVGELGLAFTGVGLLVDIASAYWDIRGYHRAHNDHKKRAESIHETEDESILTILNTFSILLDPKRGNKESLPVVLLLDDAQWMDIQSRRIVRDLWAAACKGGWPLLVIATHWQREWETAIEDENTATFAGWIHALQSCNCESIEIHKLGRLPESREILLCAFPGLNQAQVDYFVSNASGNPRHIAEIIFLLQRKPEWFENSDFTCPLNNRWNENIPTETLKLVSLERERFDAVEQAIKEILGTASLQGDRFLRAFTLDVARKLGFAQEKSDDPLLPAENPYALAEALDATSMEFRSITIRKSASDYLRNVKAEDEVLTAIASCTREWIDSGRLAGLSIHQQLPLLNRSYVSAETAEDRSSQTLFTATALQLISKSGLHFYASFWIDLWEKIDPDEEELDGCDFWLLRDTANTFLKDGKTQLARLLSHTLSKHPSLIKEEQETESFLLRNAAHAQLEGEIAKEMGQTDFALEHFRSSLEVREQILSMFGETSERLLEISISLRHLCNIERPLGEFKLALAHSLRYLKISEQIAEKFGETAESLSEISLALICVGDIERLQEQNDSALKRYLRSLEIREEIMERFGETPERLRYTSLSLERVGRIELSLKMTEQARLRFLRVLEINEQSLAKFGETPVRHRDVSVALILIGDVELLLKETDAALKRYLRNLAMAEQILTRYGETPQNLRGLSCALDRVADIELSLNQTDPALERFRRALAIDEQILIQYGETPERLSDVRISRNRVADVVLSLKQTDIP